MSLEILIDRHPDKNSILRGVNQNGSGARPGSGKAGGKSMTRGQFDQLNPVQQAQAIKEGTALTDLRPIGLVEIAGQRYEVLSETHFIPTGTKVRVTHADLAQIKVRQA